MLLGLYCIGAPSLFISTRPVVLQAGHFIFILGCPNDHKSSLSVQACIGCFHQPWRTAHQPYRARRRDGLIVPPTMLWRWLRPQADVDFKCPGGDSLT
jgi:hypothetical protein